VLFDLRRHVIVLRELEAVMVPVMLESICGQAPSLPEIEQEVHHYVEPIQGILTILQMDGW